MYNNKEGMTPAELEEIRYKTILHEVFKEMCSKENIHKILVEYDKKPHPPYQMFSFVERVEWGIFTIFVLSGFAYSTYHMIVCGLSIKSVALWILGDFLAIIIGLFILFPIMVIIDGLITRPRQMYKHWKNKLKR